SVVERIVPPSPNTQPLRLSTNTILLSRAAVPLDCRIQCEEPLSSVLRMTPLSPQTHARPLWKYATVVEAYPEKTLRNVTETPLVSGAQNNPPVLVPSIVPFSPA